VTGTDGALQLIGLHGLDAVTRKREPLSAKLPATGRSHHCGKRQLE
jgi:hypothetical protein